MEQKDSWSFEANTRPGDMLWGFLLVWSWVRRRLLGPPPQRSFANARAAGYDHGQEQEKENTCWGIHHQLWLSFGVRVQRLTVGDSDCHGVTNLPLSALVVGCVLRDR